MHDEANDIEFRYRDVARWTWGTWLIVSVLMLFAFILTLFDSHGVDGPFALVGHLLTPVFGLFHHGLLAATVGFVMVWLLSPLTWLCTWLLRRIPHPGWHMIIWGIGGAAMTAGIIASVVTVTSPTILSDALADPVAILAATLGGLASSFGWLWAYRLRFSDSPQVDWDWVWAWLPWT